jgi:hypothetical protein
MDTPRWRDLQDVIHTQAAPAANPFEVIIGKHPTLGKGMDVFQAPGIPVRDFSAVPLPGKTRRRRKTEAPEKQRDMIRLAAGDRCQQALT